jgi:uncharacterized membrane protein YwaF
MKIILAIINLLAITIVLYAWLTYFPQLSNKQHIAFGLMMLIATLIGMLIEDLISRFKK